MGMAAPRLQDGAFSKLVRDQCNECAAETGKYLHSQNIARLPFPTHSEDGASTNRPVESSNIGSSKCRLPAASVVMRASML
jgi:hypothetical protein